MADLDHPVTYVAQSQPMSCWAASAAMMMGSTEAEILQQLAAAGDDGASEPECQALAARLNLNILPEACRDADGWWQILGRGPVMVGIPAKPTLVEAGTWQKDFVPYGTPCSEMFDPQTQKLEIMRCELETLRQRLDTMLAERTDGRNPEKRDRA